MANADKPFEVLDQSEIDNLLAAAVTAPQQLVLRADGKRAGGGGPLPKVETYDFRNPVFLTEIELRRLRLLHEDFIRYLTARLSLFLRMEFGLKMAKLTTLTYAKFCDSLPSPTHICLFKAEPLLGVGILDINPRLALTVVDRMLGGRGHSVKVERYLTEIEIALFEDIILIILEEWCGQWKAEQELHPLVVGHETNGRFLQTSAKDAIMLALTLEANFGDCSEQVQIGVPYYTIEPLVKSMQARRHKDSAPAPVAARSEWKPLYQHIRLPVRAEWEVYDLPLREVLHLKVGDIVQLPSAITADTHLMIAGAHKFTGTVGLEGDTVAISLTQKVTAEDHVHANQSRR